MSGNPLCDDLGAVPLFACLSPGGLALVRRTVRVEPAGPDVRMRFPGSHSGLVLVVVEGSLRVVHVQSDGRERLVRLLHRGDFVGEAEFLLGRPPHHAAIAGPGTVLACLPHEVLDRLLRTESAFARAVLTATTARLIATEDLLTANSAGASVMGRVVTYLLRIRSGPDGEVVLPLSLADLASHLGTTPETLSRRLAELDRAGMLTRSSPRRMTINADGLRRYLADRRPTD